MKKGFKIGALSLAGLMVIGLAGCSCANDKEPAAPTEVKLPAARLATCDENDYSVTCSTITAANFDTYAERNDVMYVDLRNASEYTKSHLHGFEMVEFNKYIYGDGTGVDTPQLFDSAEANRYMPRYVESVEILEDMFPKDQTIFFMCAGGSRVVHMMKIMEFNGWDMTKIYNIGGMDHYGESKYRVDGFKVAELTPITTPVATSTNTSTTKYIASLPNARKDTCESNNYDLGCSSITSANFDDYAQMKDVLYVDLRNEEQYVPSHLHGFEMIEFYATIYGETNQLFVQSADEYNYTARYTESVEILEDIFPKDKTIFFMCAGGGRVVDMMKIMEKYGWNMNNVYNIGGMNQYSASKYKIDNFKTTDVNAITLKTGTFTETSFGHDYTTTVKVAVDNANKITNLYVSGECSTVDVWSNAATWTSNKYDFIETILGKTAAEITTKLGAGNNATGADVVTGASLSSNRVYKAILNALAA